MVGVLATISLIPSYPAFVFRPSLGAAWTRACEFWTESELEVIQDQDDTEMRAPRETPERRLVFFIRTSIMCQRGPIRGMTVRHSRVLGKTSRAPRPDCYLLTLLRTRTRAPRPPPSVPSAMPAGAPVSPRILL